MFDWLLVGVAMLILGPVMIVIGAKGERKNNESPQLVQYGYLALVIGAFVLLVQFFSITAAMLAFVLATGVVWALDRFMLAKKRGGARPADPGGRGRPRLPRPHRLRQPLGQRDRRDSQADRRASARPDPAADQDRALHHPHLAARRQRRA